ncbi:MAG TPA: hypothetical protein VFN56_04270 [Candidatus Saccharimonadales bacterium]|nr:hypothetical protein [Candidatus Saccharimonadales bacterium]
MGNAQTAARTKAAKKKGTAASTAAVRPAGVMQPRRLKRPKYTPLHIGKKVPVPVRKLPNVLVLTRQAAMVLWRHKALFAGIIIIYGLLNVVLVQGLANSTDVTSLKQTLNQAFTGHLRQVTSGLAIFVILVGSAGNGSSPTAGAYQVFLIVIVSLAVIWALRQVLAGTSVRVRDAYYKGMYPLIPLVLVLAMIAVQLLPLVIGASIYSLVVNNGIAVNGWQQAAWALGAIALACLSLYWVCSSLFAGYIVTLPDMTPMKALRSARELVRYRRWQIIRKLLWLPLLLFIVAAVIMLPIIVWLTPVAQWVFFILTMFAVAVVHAYMYSLYRELLNE